MRNGYRILVGKHEQKRPVGRLRLRWEDNIRMDVKKVGWEGVCWVYLDQDSDQWRAFVNTVMNILVP
jgi:hypothetical protein